VRAAETTVSDEPRDVLTKRQREILTIMRDKNEELIYTSGRGYVGESPVSGRTVFALLRLCAIHADDGEIYYHITGTGRKLLNNDTSDLDLLAAEFKKLQRRILRRRS
jgi:hypothetical protein